MAWSSRYSSAEIPVQSRQNWKNQNRTQFFRRYKLLIFTMLAKTMRPRNPVGFQGQYRRGLYFVSIIAPDAEFYCQDQQPQVYSSAPTSRPAGPPPEIDIRQTSHPGGGRVAAMSHFLQSLAVSRDGERLGIWYPWPSWKSAWKSSALCHVDVESKKAPYSIVFGISWGSS